MSLTFRCPVGSCPKECKSARGLTQHLNAFHPQQSRPASTQPESSDTKLQRWVHPYLTALPCDEDGNFVPAASHPQPPHPLDATPENPFHPFQDRLAFEFADFFFCQLQASESSINRALQLWAAQAAKYGADDVPWRSANKVYDTIDQIQQGNNPWKSVSFRYRGPLPQDAPTWMTKKYELVTRDICDVLREQIACTNFDGHWDYSPFREFNSAGDRVWTNLMSGEWAAKEADEISKDPLTHGAMFVSVVAGSDKTVASIATGQQEFHPLYIGPGNIDNAARRSHGIGLLPCAFLPIPKTSAKERTTVAYQQFCRQLFHTCLSYVYSPLKPIMTTPEVFRCPDQHFHRAIFSIGPYIADYPEQVWLSAIVQNWCPLCDARPDNLDDFRAHLRTHEKTDFLLDAFSPGIVWDEYGLRSDVVLFTHGFPRADIHKLITPDLLHQLIKGVFKDHLVSWVQEYLSLQEGPARAHEIIEDIDRRISIIPAYAGLRHFPAGRDFNQWTGDDSKALMKVYITAIQGHVPGEMVKCLSAFMNCCYIARRNTITTSDVTRFRQHLAEFHGLRQIFVTTAVRKGISLPRQHALMHYPDAIELFGSPNGTDSSQTEAKHIPVVKKPWRRSNRHKPLPQMLQTITRLDKFTALRQVFKQRGMLAGTVTEYMAQQFAGNPPPVLPWSGPSANTSDYGSDDGDNGNTGNNDAEAAPGPRTNTMIWLAARHQSNYPSSLAALADFIHQPDFPHALHTFIHEQNHPNSSHLAPPDDSFKGPIRVFHSMKAQYYAPSDLCGISGMHREVIHANPRYGHRGLPRFDTVFISVNDNKEVMGGLLVARVWLLFSFFDPYHGKDIPCALVSWFVHQDDDPKPDEENGMWKVCPEYDEDGGYPVQVIHLDTILRGAHLLPCYGKGFIPVDVGRDDALDYWDSYFVNQFIDHHAYELLTS